MNYKNKKVLVYGLGASGRSVIRLLQKIGADVYVFDDDINEKEIPKNVTVVPCADFSDVADLTILSPAISIDNPSIQKAVAKNKVTGELAFAADFLESEFIAVSGTNGKTTVTLMINDVLNGAGYESYALGNIGVPLSEKALSLTSDDIAVVEVSSFQLETTKRLCPDIAVLTNVTSDHLDRHKTLDNYKNLKAKLFEGQCDREISVFNADDETSEEISKIVKSDKFFFSAKKRVRGAYLDGNEIVFEDEKRIHIANCGELSACAGVNLENVLATTATCMARKINPEIIRMTLKSFAAPLYRTTYLGEKRGKKFYNDSKGTNISATLKSAESMRGNTVLILGGRGKGENFEDLFKKLPKNVIHAFITGENAREIMDGAIAAGFYNVTYRQSLKECFMESTVVRADNVLFSPASSSFDRYKNFVERGKAFDDLFFEL